MVFWATAAFPVSPMIHCRFALFFCSSYSNFRYFSPPLGAYKEYQSTVPVSRKRNLKITKKYLANDICIWYYYCIEARGNIMALVYRVELKFSILDEDFKKNWYSTNIGPYVGRLRIQNIGGYSVLNMQTSIECQPEPEDDGMKQVPYGKVFGFADIEQFCSWFKDDMANLDWSGFALALYEVPDNDVMYGNSQLAFSLSTAKLIKYFESCRDVYCDYFDEKCKVLFASAI